jgi:hypothetical protein
VRVFLFINSQGFNCCLLWLHVIVQVDHWLETIRIQLHFCTSKFGGSHGFPAGSRSHRTSRCCVENG